jgi:arylsulfatase A-like enzyme
MTSKSPPNVVFVFPDQFRQQAIGFMQQDPVITPNLDRFASESLVLTHAVSNYPVCSPYRAMLFTGKYPFSTGVIDNCYSGTIPYGIELRASERCLSDVLHDIGYSLGYIGKFHLDSPREEHIPFTEGWRGQPGEGSFWDAYTPPGPRRHGFDFWHSYGCCDQHLTPHYWHGEAKVDERTDIEGWSVQHETDVAVDYIHNRDGTSRDPEQPFALFIAHNPPHTPFDQVPEKYVRRYEGQSARDLLTRPNVRKEGQGQRAFEHVKHYFAAVTGIDEQFGRILQALDDAGLTEDTIVVFSADHGEMMGSHGRMHKGVWYDEALLIPFIIRWPGHITPGRDDLLLSVPDIMPSLLSLMGLGAHIPSEVEGNGYAGAFLGETIARPEAALYLRVPPAAPQLGARGLRTHRYTFAIEHTEGQVHQYLYDNQADPYQLHNIASECPEVVKVLTRRLQSRLKETRDPFVLCQ